MLAGFFIKYISATGAKTALFFGLVFYILTTFIFKVNIHFIHIWGIEFVLNMIIMFVVSYYYPRKTFNDKADALKVDMHSWKYAYHLSAVLVFVTVMIYIALGHQ